MEKTASSKIEQTLSHANFTVIQFWDNITNQLSSEPALRARIRRALFLHGSRRATIRILVAVVLNHIRRLLAPWLGQFFWYHAIEDMKLARSSPHYFLADSASCFSWLGFTVWTAVTVYGLPRAWKFLGQAAIRDTQGDVWAILDGFALLTWLESCYVQTCWAGAQLYAYEVLFWKALGYDGQAEKKFLEKLLAEQPARVTTQLGLVTELLVHNIVPTLWRGLQGAWAVLMVSGLVWSVTLYLVKYSNKFFLLLEMSDIFITFGWAVLGMVCVGVEALRNSDVKSKGGDTDEDKL